MATILDKLTPGAEFGERIGRGTSSALQSLIDAKFSQLQRQAGLMGTFNPQQSEMLSQLPEGLAAKIIPQAFKQQQFQQGLQTYGGSQAGMQAQEGLPSQDMQAQTGVQTQGNIAPETERIKQAALQAHIASGGDPRVVAKAVENEKNRIAKERQFQVQQETETRKELEPLRKEVDAARTFDTRTLGSIRAAQSGDMRRGTKQLFMERFGLGDAFRNPTTQAGQKDLEGFALGVAQAFGPGMGRIIQKEFEAFVKSNANKFNDPEVIDYIGQVNLLKNQLLYDKQDMRMEIIKANNNRIPIDLPEQVEQKTLAKQQEIKNKMDTINKLFAQGKLAPFDKADNPANFKDGTTTVDEKTGVPYIKEDGIWKVDFSRLKED